MEHKVKQDNKPSTNQNNKRPQIERERGAQQRLKTAAAKTAAQISQASQIKTTQAKPARAPKVMPRDVVGKPLPKLPQLSLEQIQSLQKRIEFPETLPVSQEKDAICELIAKHQVVIICGETGSGKTTQLPKMCLSLGRGIGAGGRGLIGHTQPRRLAATSTAKRIAEELNSELGQIVGYKIRFADKLQKQSLIHI